MEEGYKIEIMGTISTDTTLSLTKTNKEYVRFTITVSNKYIDSNTKEEKFHVDYFNVTAWGKVAKDICSSSQKGSHIKVEAKRTQNEYTNSKGVTVRDWNINVKSFEMMDDKNVTKSPKETPNPQPQNGPQGSELPF